MTTYLQGRVAARGIAIGKAYKITSAPKHPTHHVFADVDSEIRKLNNAITLSIAQLEVIEDEVLEEFGEFEADIFKAHSLMLTDVTLISQIEGLIKNAKLPAADACDRAISTFIDALSLSQDTYLKERISDFLDVKNRLLSNLDPTFSDFNLPKEPVILVAESLLPSDMARLDKTLVIGVVTKDGGTTSHGSILARRMGVPSLVGVLVDLIGDGNEIILDAVNGQVINCPTKDIILEFETTKKDLDLHHAKYDKVANLPAQTKDGHKFELAINITSDQELRMHDLKRFDGVGLYRTEFLFIRSNELPSNKQQFDSYKNVLDAFSNSKVVIRTLDAGGDKAISYLPFDYETNPFLGNRGLRFSIDHDVIFKSQIKAMLLANKHGNLHIMLPMVSVLDEIVVAKKMIEQVKEQLKEEGIRIKPYKLGIMVEVPSAALHANVLAKHVDFFSIGSNDLIQYTFAADRLNPNVTNLYQPYHPTLIALIRHVIESSHQNKIWTGLCGEMGSDVDAALLLVGLGIDEISVNPDEVSKIKWHLKQCKYEDLKKLVEKAIKQENSDDVLKLIRAFRQKRKIL